MAIQTIIPPVAESGQAGAKPVHATTEMQRIEMNASIVQTTINVSFSAEQQPLNLVYSSAIDKLNEVLEAEYGVEAIQSAADSGMDFSPEATAERIVGFATSFFGAFMDRQGGEDKEGSLQEFMDIIRGAIDKGFEEAKDILEGLQVLEGDIASNIDQTYNLIQEGLDRFQADQSGASAEV